MLNEAWLSMSCSVLLFDVDGVSLASQCARLSLRGISLTEGVLSLSGTYQTAIRE